MNVKRHRVISPYESIAGMKSFRGPWHTHMAAGFPDPRSAGDICREHGFHFVGVTDHDNKYSTLDWSERDWHRAADEKFIFIRGFEATHPIGHVTCLGFSPEQTGVDAEKARRNRCESMELDAGYGGFLERASGLGAFLALNHPRSWRDDTGRLLEYPAFRLIDAMEIYNGNQLGKSRAAGYTPDIYDRCLDGGASLWLAANPDCHSWNIAEPDGPFNGYSVVFSDELSRDGNLRALKAGRFYSTNGLELEEISVGLDRIKVAAGNSSRISFIGPGGRLLEQVDAPSSEYVFSGSEGWVRVEIESLKASHPGAPGFPLKAWLQPARFTGEV